MTRPRGRPPRADGPAFDTEEVERIYRDGVLVEREDGSLERIFPGPTEIAEQFGVSGSTISRYAKKHGLAELRRARMAELGEAVRSRPKAHRPPGRPRRGEEPQVDWAQVERDYIEGVAYRRADGTAALVFPDQIDLAERHKVSEATISRFLSQRDARQRRKAVLETLPARVEVPLNSPSPERTMNLLGSANANLIEGGRLLSQQWVDSVRAGDVRANDPVVVEKGIRMALDAEAREAGVGTTGATIQIPVEYLERARRALERRQVPLDPMMTGIVIDAASAPVDAAAPSAAGDT
ncbi:MAG: hypothetical protein HS111_09980 [Kofleriaceae bacterium]|nr:hypothetical protein [Kofleriaceae bacterium]